MNLAGDAGGLAEEAVGKLEVMVEPPLEGALHANLADVRRDKIPAAYTFKLN